MSSYLSILGISTIDNVVGNNVNVQNVNTNSISVSSLSAGLVSSNASGTLQNSNVSVPLSYNSTNSTLSIALTGSTGINYQVIGNTGYISSSCITSITSGQTGPVYISQSSTGSVEIALPQNLTTSSSPQFARLLNSSLGTFSVIQGSNAGAAFSGDRCVLIGDSVMAATSSSQQSTAIGNSALGFATGNFNTAVGANAGFVITSGTTNTIVGTNAGRGSTPLTTGSGNVLLGAGANTSSGSSSNEIVIGFGVGSGNNTAKIYASNGLNVSNLTNGVLKATSGTITSTATTDDLTEGKTNLYFTNARAQGAFTAGTGIDISSGIISNTSVTGTTGPIGPIGPTGPIGYTGYTGPIGLGVGGGTAFFAEYHQTGNQGISVTGTQILFPTIEHEVGFSMTAGNVTFGYSGVYNVQVVLQLSASNNSTCYVWYKINGVNAVNSGNYYDFASGSGEQAVSELFNVVANAGDVLQLWGLTTRGTVNIISAVPGSIFPTAPGVSVVINQVTYSQLGPTGVTGATGPIYSGTAPILVSSSNISLGYNTNNLKLTGSNLDTIQDIATNSSPQFSRLINSSIGTSNVLIGSFSGASLTSGGGNTLIGQGAGNNITSGTFNIGIGANAYGGSGAMTATSAGNIAVGISSLFSCTSTAAHNTAIGFLALQSLTTGVGNIAIGNSCANNLLTGNNNVYIGQAITSSTTSVSNEGAINLTGSGITGYGPNTFFINATSGLYGYSPAYFSGYFSSLLFGNFNVATISTRAISVSANIITLPYIGTYEICLSGTLIITAVPSVIYHFVNGVAFPYAGVNNVFISSIIGYSPLSYCMQITTTAINTTTNFTYYTVNPPLMNAAAPTFVTIKFIGL